MPGTAASRSGSAAPPTSGRGPKNLRSKPFRAEIEVDGVGWFKGKASCILLGNVGELFGGVEVFEDARPDDGKLEVGVVTAEGLLEWGRMIARAAVGTASTSPLAQTTKARSVKVKLNRKVRYELDGGDRSKVKSFKAKVEPSAITVCVPRGEVVSPSRTDVSRRALSETTYDNPAEPTLSGLGTGI